MSSETDLSRAITKALEVAGCLVIRIQSGTLRLPGRVVKCAPKGTPDLCVIVPGGAVLWLEIKTATGKVSAEQKQMHERLRGLGQHVHVARSVSEALSFAGALTSGDGSE